MAVEKRHADTSISLLAMRKTVSSINLVVGIASRTIIGFVVDFVV